MEIRRVPLTQLQPASYNPRKALVPGSAAYRRLERSLKEFSLVQPLVWNEQTGNLVGGHQRLEILKQQGVSDVDVVVVSLPLSREKALNIALNNQQVASDWDTEKLGDVLQELCALPDMDVTLTGFDEQDLKHLLLGPADAVEPDVAPGPAVVEIRITLPPDDWEAARPGLDDWLREHPAEVQIKLPVSA